MFEDYDKHMTGAFTEVIQNDQNVLFEDIHFERIPKEDIIPTTLELETWGMFDPGRYRKAELQQMVKGFLEEMDMVQFQKRVHKVKNQRLIKNQKQIYAIQPHLYNLLHQFVLEKSKQFPFRLRKVRLEHIMFIKKLMGKQQTRNLTLAQKAKLLQREFNLSLSTTTINRI